MVGEQIGFDEGGVFESLRDPVYSKVTTETKYRHNKDGLVTSEKTTVTTKQLTGSQALAIIIGPPLIAAILGLLDLDLDKDDIGKMLAGTVLLGPFLGPLAGLAAGKAGDVAPDPGTQEGWVKWWLGLLGIDAEF